ncbi:MAG TPA: hypothetical protein DCY13_11220 [Verrucomicrobiales bacterium]|nr:hypothetical protein [Verrucomicrobiales bacterium]
MLALEEARDRLLAAIQPLPPESVALPLASGRYLADSVRAANHLPPFDNSAMDGYAVLASDVAQASSTSPVTLRCIGETAAGQFPGGGMIAGQCWRLFTGSPLPDGADAVVMQEDTRPVDGQPQAVQVMDAVRPWENVRFRGEDVKAGATIAEAGARLDFGHLALLAATGVSEVTVVRRPVIGVISTGSELVEPGGALQPGQIYESNRRAIEVLVQRAGGVPRSYPVVPDDLKLTQEIFAMAFRECDAVVSSGGVSVGAHDHVKSAVEALGGRLDFWKVAIRPGKPFTFGHVDGRQFFGLPGNPVSAVVTFLLLVRPALIRMQGGVDVQLPVSFGVLAEPVTNRGNRRHFVRVRLDSRGRVRLSGLQGSHVMSSLAGANGLLDMPPEAHWEEGRMTEVIRID